MGFEQVEKNIEERVGLSAKEIRDQPFDETRVYLDKKYSDFNGRILPQKKGKILMADGTYITLNF